MIQYRNFRNPDPPAIVELWHDSRLGRGAAKEFNTEAFESLTFSQPYFDPRGVILAENERGEIIGYAHGGFARGEQDGTLNKSEGVVCSVIVHPDYRRQKIGTQLLAKTEDYLREQGAETLWAGPARDRDPYYVGLYGGSRPSGFLVSDELSQPFFEHAGYQPTETHLVFQRDIANRKDPINFRLVTLRRKMEIEVVDIPAENSWWWYTRFGRLDTVRCQLYQKSTKELVAAVTIVGLDLYINCWQERAVGLCDLYVSESERRKGYGQLLLHEVIRRMREELITRIEVHSNAADDRIIGLVTSCGFEQVDTGIVYKKA